VALANAYSHCDTLYRTNPNALAKYLQLNCLPRSDQIMREIGEDELLSPISITLCKLFLTGYQAACYLRLSIGSAGAIMVRERVAEDVYVFTSELYAQVNAGAIVGPEWSVLIDTLAYPEETLEIKEFLEERLSSPVRYLVNTHYHSDHTLGNSWFPNSIIIGHANCRKLLDTVGRKSLEEAKRQNRELRDVKIVLPDVVFSKGGVGIRVGKRTLRLVHLPGHSADGIGVLVVEDRVLFSGDIMMPIPYLVDGDYEQMVESLKRIPRMKLENLVQGHGEVILRGEVSPTVRHNLKYLNTIRKHVRQAYRRKDFMSYLEDIDVQACGKSRILLGGLAEDLHQRNLLALFKHWYPHRVNDEDKG
jgi:cyclase